MTLSEAITHVVQLQRSATVKEAQHWRANNHGTAIPISFKFLTIKENAVITNCNISHSCLFLLSNSLLSNPLEFLIYLQPQIFLPLPPHHPCYPLHHFLCLYYKFDLISFEKSLLFNFSLSNSMFLSSFCLTRIEEPFWEKRRMVCFGR